MHRIDPFIKTLDSESHRKSPSARMLQEESGSQQSRTKVCSRNENMNRVTQNGSPNQFGRTSTFNTLMAPSKIRRQLMRDSQAATPQNAFTVEANVIEPLRMLHRCICYFSSHPEIYGTNIRGLLEREHLYVMRVKASETALLLPTPVPVSDVALPPISAMKPNHQKMHSTDEHLQQSRNNTNVVPSGNVDDSRSLSHLISTPNGIFGYGGTSFVQASPGFLSLVDKRCRHVSLQEDGTSGQIDPQGQPQQTEGFAASGRDSPLSMHGLSTFAAFLNPNEAVQGVNGEQRGSRSVAEEALNDNGSLRGHLASAPARLLIDGPGYEVCFLRNQLQQVEAAYNAKCIGLHELRLEHNRNLTELTSAKKKIQDQSARINEMRVQIENMKRELDAWKQRASELDLHNSSNNNGVSAVESESLQAVQLKDSRREHTNLMRLWRETEKSLQETRRSLESTQKETLLSHNYLTDAFYLVERLERRVERRDAFIETQRRRQKSLEEKYEKLIWCFQEMETLRGGHSYVDFLLSKDPIWSLFLFVRLQRHVNGYSQMEELAPSPAAAKETLPFCRTITGGKFLDAYSPSLIQACVMDDINTRRTSDDLSTPYGCQLLRWLGAFSIHYLNGYASSVVDQTGLLRRSLPVLSIASILFGPTESPTVASSTGRAPSVEPAPDATTEATVPNSQRYSQATLRLILYCFWNSRLAQYQRLMEKRVEALREGSPHRSGRSCAENSTIIEDDIATKSSNDESLGLRIPTFLASLVSFVQRFFSPSNNASNLTTSFLFLRDPPGSPMVPLFLGEDVNEPGVSVRGVKTRTANNTGNVGGTGSGVSQEGSRIFHGTLYSTRAEDGVEEPLVLSPQARELLYALYYYAEEYKHSDADFHLFFLVAHQQLPELVAINFYASMEALRSACDEALCRHLDLQTSPPLPSVEAAPAARPAGEAQAQPSPALDVGTPGQILQDTPLAAIRQAVELIDSAPLVEEKVDLDPDSEGEGYGCILPGQTTAVDGQRNSTAVSQPASPILQVPSESSKDLKHNIYAYLFPEATESERLKATQRYRKGAHAEGEKRIPAAWDNIDEALGTVLGSHASLLAALKEAKTESRPQLTEVQSHKRREFANQASSLSAARGLLPFEELLALMKIHCFSTYALSCCGTPRFSLVETLCSDKETAAALSPLTRIGQLPPTELHMRRLRFAVALDQPSTLIDYQSLFAVDPKHGTASHFHDEYLRLTIDLYLAQQEAWMNVVRHACLARHDGSEGIEHCDGEVYFPFLRGAVAEQFKVLRIGALQSQLYAKHFTNYCEVLRHDESVRVEQFVDAPFFINVQSLSEDDVGRDYAEGLDHYGTIEDDATVCALHHLALAVRMTYVIWGIDAAVSARLAVKLLPHTTRRQFRSTNHLYVPRGPEVTEGEEITIDEPSAETRMDNFVAEVNRDYADAVQRVNTGVEGHNALRRAALQLNSLSLDANKLSDHAQTGMTNTQDNQVKTSSSTEEIGPSDVLPSLLNKDVDAEHIVGKDTNSNDNALSLSLAHVIQADMQRLYTLSSPNPRMTPQVPRRNTSGKTSRSNPRDAPDSAAAAAAALVAAADQLALPAVDALARFLGIRRGPPARGKGSSARRAKGSARAPTDPHAALEAPCRAGGLALLGQQARFARQVASAGEGASGAAQQLQQQQGEKPQNGEETAHSVRSSESVSGDSNKEIQSAAMLKVRANCAALSRM